MIIYYKTFKETTRNKHRKKRIWYDISTKRDASFSTKRYKISWSIRFVDYSLNIYHAYNINFHKIRKPCETAYRYTADGERVRVSKRTGQIIPIPPDAESTVDYKSKRTYKRMII